MNRLTQRFVVQRRSRGASFAALCEAARLQSSASRVAPSDDDVLTSFPGDAAAVPDDNASEPSLHRTRHRQRYRGSNSSSSSNVNNKANSEADGLLKDIFHLEKQVAAEQQRQRLSVRASQLGQSPDAGMAQRRPRAASTSSAAVAQMMESEGLAVPEVSEKVAAATAAPTPPPTLSVPSPEQTAAAASRARELDGEVATFVKAAATAAAPPLTSASRPSAVAATATAAAAAVPPLHSWVPPFALTSEQLRSSLDGVASEVAFTLEELEDTLFSPSTDVEEKDATATDARAGAPTTSTAAPPPPPPPSPPTAPDAAALHKGEVRTNATVSRGEATSADKATTAAEQKVGATVDSAPLEELRSGEQAASLALTNAPRQPPAASVNAERSKQGIPQHKQDQQSTLFVATPRGSSPVPRTPSPIPLPPLVKCRLRGAAVVVTLSRAAGSLVELLEALQEAITFAESLPPLSPANAREVRLRVDTTAPACAGLNFIDVSDGMSDMLCATEEKVQAQWMKEGLFRRMQAGQREGRLHFVAELQVVTPSATAASEANSPVVLRDFAAELLLACDAHEVRHVSRPNTRLDGEGKDAVQLSFRGICVGLFPAPATIRRAQQLVALMRTNGSLDVVQLVESVCAVKGSSSHPLHAPSVMLCLHLLPVSVSTALLTARNTAVTADASEDNAVAGASMAAVLQRKVMVWVREFYATCSQQWAAWMQQTQPRLGGLHPAQRTADEPSLEASLSACVTAAQVWSWMGGAVLHADAKDTDAACHVTACALRAAPLRRCHRHYARVACTMSAVDETSGKADKNNCNGTNNSIRSAAGLAPLSSSTAAVMPFIMEVSSSTLAHTSVADLASEIRDQPSNVVLALHPSIPLEGRLKFLASLHLTDTGAHHTVTVLLAGAPSEMEECASLTRSSARLSTPSPSSAYGASTAVSPCDPAWLHHLIEVSAARSTGSSAVLVSRGEATTTPEAAAAVQFVARTWHRPCVITSKSEVGLTLRKALEQAERHLLAKQTTTSSVSTAEKRQRLLSPLVLLSAGAGSVVTAAVTPLQESTHVNVQAGNSAPLGLAFLTVLDAACQALCRESDSLTPADVDVLSVAALQLDGSAGGIFEAADRVCGDDVQSVVAAMEAAAATEHVTFASLPLVRWMLSENLLFYQLNRNALARYAKSASTV